MRQRVCMLMCVCVCAYEGMHSIMYTHMYYVHIWTCMYIYTHMYSIMRATDAT